MKAWLKRLAVVVLLGLALHLLLPLIGGLRQDLRALSHARPGFMVVGIAAEVVSILAYVLLYQRVLRAMGHAVPIRPVGRVILASFFVSHVVPGGSAAGTVVNVDTMRSCDVPPPTTTVAVTLTTLLSDLAMIGLLATGIAYSLFKRHLPTAYITTAVIAIPIVFGLLGLVLLAAFRPEIAGRLGRRVGEVAHRIRPRVDPDAVGRAAHALAVQVRTAFTWRTLLVGLGLAELNWLADLFVLYLFFLALGHHQHFGALMVAYAVANLVAAVPLTPGGLGVIEATLIAVSVGFGAPRSVAVVAVIGYRLVNFWLPLPISGFVFFRQRLKAGARTPRPGDRVRYPAAVGSASDNGPGPTTPGDTGDAAAPLNVDRP